MLSFSSDLSLSIEAKAFKSSLSVIRPTHLSVWFLVSVDRDTLSKKPCIHSSDKNGFSLKRVW